MTQLDRSWELRDLIGLGRISIDTKGYDKAMGIVPMPQLRRSGRYRIARSSYKSVSLDSPDTKCCENDDLICLEQTAVAVYALPRTPIAEAYDMIEPICERELDRLIACAMFPELSKQSIVCGSAINTALRLKWNKKAVDYKDLANRRSKNGGREPMRRPR